MKLPKLVLLSIGRMRSAARAEGPKPNILFSLLADLKKWRESVGAQMMTPNPAYDPARETQGPEKVKKGKDAKAGKKPKGESTDPEAEPKKGKGKKAQPEADEEAEEE